MVLKGFAAFSGDGLRLDFTSDHFPQRVAMRAVLKSPWQSPVGFLGIASLVLMVSGCGGGDRPPLGKVTGKVTINGEPLTGVIVVFQPEEGRAAVAETGPDGSYEMSYLDGVKGAKLGPTNVSFAAPTGGSPSHPIPPKYQGKTDLEVDVQSGNNTFDFDLETEGGGAAPAAKKGKAASLD